MLWDALGRPGMPRVALGRLRCAGMLWWDECGVECSYNPTNIRYKPHRGTGRQCAAGTLAMGRTRRSLLHLEPWAVPLVSRCRPPARLGLASIAWRRWHSLCGGEPLAAILSGAEVQVPKLRISKRPLGLATAMRQAVKSRSRDLRLARTCTRYCMVEVWALLPSALSQSKALCSLYSSANHLNQPTQPTNSISQLNQPTSSCCCGAST